MKLYILRHGEAAEHGDPRYREDERPLTRRGIQRTRQLGHALRQMEISFDAVLSSPLVRARETAEVLVRSLKWKGRLRLVSSLEPSGRMDLLVKEIHRLRPEPVNVLLVGHEPYLSGLISLLCVGGPALEVKLKKGALCRLEVDHLICGKCAILDWLLQPRVIGVEPARRQRAFSTNP